MKLKGLFIALALILSATAIHAQSSLFNKLGNNKSINSIYISKAMLSMAPNTNVGGANVKDIASKLEQLEIYTSETKDAASMMRKEVEILAKNKTYELLMNMKDGGDTVSFYALKNKDKFKELIMVTDESEQCVIIRMVGDFTMEEIQKVTGK